MVGGDNVQKVLLCFHIEHIVVENLLVIMPIFYEKIGAQRYVLGLAEEAFAHLFDALKKTLEVEGFEQKINGRNFVAV